MTKKAKQDETGLEIAGCRHGLAQWAVNMYYGELYGYAHFIQQKKMLSAPVKYFWEDVVCQYWKWAQKVDGVSTSAMMPALSVMHAKAHNWTCQVCFYSDVHCIICCLYQSWTLPSIAECMFPVFCLLYLDNMGWDMAGGQCVFDWRGG